MIENERLEDEAEEIRRETAEGSPEVAEHDRVAELERQLEEANSKALYAAAEIQNVRRRLESEKAQAATYATTQFARDMLAIKDHLERALGAVSEELRADKVASNFLAGMESTARELEAVFSRHGITRIERDGRAARSAPAPGDDGSPERRRRAGHDRRRKCSPATCSRTGCCGRRLVGVARKP